MKVLLEGFREGVLERGSDNVVICCHFGVDALLQCFHLMLLLLL